MAEVHNPCPTCGRKGDWFAGAYGPFCSRRCKLVDLGKWFGEEHSISEPLRPDHFLAEDEESDKAGWSESAQSERNPA